MMIEFIAGILAVALVLYSVLGGADFGGGILEIFKGRKRSQDQVALITHAMGPVWEANHMWLIIAVVIMFNGFPMAYSTLCTVYHIPMVIMLFGIVLRGCSFTFRHYDIKKKGSQKIYSLIFAASSTFTPLMMGVIIGSCLIGDLNSLENHSYWEVYIAPWFNIFCFSVGIFVCSIFTTIAAVFLVVEAGEDRELADIFRRRALSASLISFIAGVLVFATGWLRGFDLIYQFTSRYVALFSMASATIAFIGLLWGLIYKRKEILLLVSAQMLFIFTGFLGVMFPDFIKGTDNVGLGVMDIYHTAAGESTLYYLAWALIIGLIIIFPLLGYLLYIFKVKSIFKR